jgi:hypothetical protein
MLKATIGSIRLRRQKGADGARRNKSGARGHEEDFGRGMMMGRAPKSTERVDELLAVLAEFVPAIHEER